MMKRVVMIAATVALLGGCSNERATTEGSSQGAKVEATESKSEPMTHEAEVAAWRETRRTRLTAEGGWLSLTGLFWLKEGENRVGSDEDSEVRLPARAPALVAKLVKRGDVVMLHDPAPGLTIDEKPAAERRIEPDTAEKPTVMNVGDITFQVIERGGKLAVRVKDAQAPTRTGFKGLEYFPVSAKYRVEARLEPHSPPKTIPIVNVLNMTEEMKTPGALVFEIDGKEHRLDAVLEPGETDLFVIFADQTNGKETYGAGRYVYTRPPDANGRTILDFNKAYNPPCAFTDFATCPLPPRQNRLALRIEAGEKKYADSH